MNFNGVNFVDKYWADKTEAEFVKHEAHHGLTAEQLKEAFALMQPKKNTVDKPIKKGGGK